MVWVLHGRAPGNAEAELEQRRIVDETFGAQLLGEPEIAGIEDLHLRLDAIGLDEPRLLAQLAGVCTTMVLPSPKLSVPQSSVQISGRSSATCRSRSTGPTRSVSVPHFMGLASAPTSRSPPMPAVRLMMTSLFLARMRSTTSAIEIDTAGALAGLRIAHMAVDDGRAGGGRFERRIGDLLGRDRNGRMLADRVAGAGHGAGDDDFGVHGTSPRGRSRARRRAYVGCLRAHLTFFAIDL